MFKKRTRQTWGVEEARSRVWKSEYRHSELAPLECLTCKQPRHISRKPTRDTVWKKTGGKDTRGLRRSFVFVRLYDFMWVKIAFIIARKEIK